MKNKKTIILSITAIIVMIIALVGVTYAFFSYYRTGSENIVETGDIYFSSDYTSVTLENVFPIDKATIETDTKNVLTVRVHIEGHTSYEEGIDYFVKASDVNITVNNKNVPLSVNVTSENVPNVSVTSYEDGALLSNDSIFASGNIKPSDGEVDGYIILRAYIDKAQIAITDTPTAENEEWINGRTVLTTEEWNNLQANPLSFKISLIAYEHVEKNLYNIMKNRAVMDNIASDFVTSSSGINFGKTASDENGKGVYIRSGTENEQYPIMYYRGEVDNNNVLFANYCWKVVRTTDTGGVKLIYNGVPTDGQCNNTGTASQLATKKYFNYGDSPAHNGYMYGKAYYYSYISPNDGRNTYYGNSFKYENGVYTLVDTSKTLDANHHYSCNSTNANATCKNIKYYFYHSGSAYGSIEISGGIGIEEALAEMQINTNDSIIKQEIDNWYTSEESKMTNYTRYLEDTIWCNDRRIDTTTTSWNPNGGNIGKQYLYYAPYERAKTTYEPLLTCLKNDAFTVDESEIGNGDLDYPIALITSDEVMLAGTVGYTATTSNYLYTGENYWTMSPTKFFWSSSTSYENHVSVFKVDSSSAYKLYESVVASYNGVRPAISLKVGTEIKEGNGTPSAPYVIETN